MPQSVEKKLQTPWVRHQGPSNPWISVEAQRTQQCLQKRRSRIEVEEGNNLVV
jgi:hypothetical protein